MNYKALKARSWCASLTDTLQRRKRSRFAHLAETQGRIEADLPSIPGKPWLAAKRLSSQGPQADRKLGSSGAFSCHLHVGSAITCLLKEDSAKDGLKKGLEKKKKKSPLAFSLKSCWCLLREEFSLFLNLFLTGG